MLFISMRFSHQKLRYQSNLANEVFTAVHYFLLLITKWKLAMLEERACPKRYLLLITVLLVAKVSTAFAQPLIEEQQRLYFGTLAISSNASVSRFTYPRTGSNVNIQGQFVLIASGTPGRYSFTGFPANTTLSVSLNSTTLSAGFGGISEPLTVDNYDIAEITTDAQGAAELALGARLNTTGNGGSYVDTLYSGTALLRVEYWEPDVQGYVFNTKVIELETELRSTLTVNQEQQLNFGTLFARSSNTAQAVLVLSPSGSYSISEPGNSRLVSLVKPDQGVIKVSGAAPNYSLTITPQATDVLLEHTQSPGSTANLILSALVTSPEGTGTTDVNGELLITVGGTLKTEVTASPAVYPAGEYEGTYQLTVSY